MYACLSIKICFKKTLHVCNNFSIIAHILPYKGALMNTVHTFFRNIVYSVILFSLILIVSCAGGVTFSPINGFSDEANSQIKEFLVKMEDYQGRKLAVFDGDGTVFGQAPHYLADECLYMYAADHPKRKPGIIDKMKTQSNVSLPYVQNRVHYLSGLTLEEVRNMGDACYKKHYNNKIYQPMKQLIGILMKNGFEVWVVTASPEALYQKFLSRELGIPITNVVGVKSVIKNGVITDQMVQPVPQDHGKMYAIETFVQDRPQLVAGNSRGDKEMIEYSSGLKIMVNPDRHVAPDQDMSMADYAKKHNWLTIDIRDVPPEDFPSISSKEFNIRVNKSRKSAD